MVKNLPAMQETWVRSLGWEDPLEKGMATHSSILAWRILWTEEPGGLQSMGSERVRQDWVITHTLDTFIWLPAYHQLASYNYHQVTQLSFLLVVITFKICSLSNFQVYSTMLTIITMLYIRSLACSPYDWKFVPTLPRSPHSSHPQPLSIIILLPSMSLSFLDYTDKWNNTVFVFLCLTYFT